MNLQAQELKHLAKIERESLERAKSRDNLNLLASKEDEIELNKSLGKISDENFDDYKSSNVGSKKDKHVTNATSAKYSTDPHHE